MKKNEFGVWEISLPPVGGKPAIQHNTKVKVSWLVEVLLLILYLA